MKFVDDLFIAPVTRPTSAPPAARHPANPSASRSRADAARIDAGRAREAIALFPVRLFLAAGWLRAAAEKIISNDWHSGETLRRFLDDQQDHTLSLYLPFAERVVEPLAVPTSAMVLLLELSIGVALLVGFEVRAALGVAIFLNMNFLMAGEVNPSAFYLVMQVSLMASTTFGIVAARPERRGRLLAFGARDLGIATSRMRKRRRALWALPPLGFALIFLPDVRAMSPEQAIEDPALMVVFIGLLASLCVALRCLTAPADPTFAFASARTAAATGPVDLDLTRNGHPERQPERHVERPVDDPGTTVTIVVDHEPTLVRTGRQRPLPDLG